MWFRDLEQGLKPHLVIPLAAGSACSFDELSGDDETLFALRDTAKRVVASEVEDLDELGLDELWVLALELVSGFLESFFDRAAGAVG